MPRGLGKTQGKPFRFTAPGVGHKYSLVSISGDQFGVTQEWRCRDCRAIIVVTGSPGMWAFDGILMARKVHGDCATTSPWVSGLKGGDQGVGDGKNPTRGDGKIPTQPVGKNLTRVNRAPKHLTSDSP